MNAYTDERLRAAVSRARKRAQAVGPLHADWDYISDGECLLAGEPTLMRGERQDLVRRITDGLERDT